MNGWARLWNAVVICITTMLILAIVMGLMDAIFIGAVAWSLNLYTSFAYGLGYATSWYSYYRRST